MIICICNNISESDLRADPTLNCLVGSSCGKCIEEEYEWTGIFDDGTLELLELQIDEIRVRGLDNTNSF